MVWFSNMFVNIIDLA